MRDSQRWVPPSRPAFRCNHAPEDPEQRRGIRDCGSSVCDDVQDLARCGSRSDVWIGALVTGVLFTIGKVLIGWYLGRSDVASSYGAAASLITILLWIYYSSLILLFGAELTKVYTESHGSRRGVPLAAGARSGAAQHGLDAGRSGG